MALLQFDQIIFEGVIALFLPIILGKGG